MGKTISKLRVFNENYIVPMVARAKAACPSPTAAENGAQGPPPSPNAADKVSDSTPESSPAGDGKALAEAPVSAQPTGAPSKLPAGKFEFKPTKGADDIEVLPVSGGWEASLDAGKETYKVGTDAK